MRARGLDVIALTLGEPDFSSPDVAIRAAHHAAMSGDTRYPAVVGTVGLKDAIQRKFSRDSGLAFTHDEILVGHGARQVIFDALIATLDPGCEVIVPAPYWNAYPLIARMAGCIPVFVECAASDGFLPRPEALAAAVTPRTRWLVLNFPNNPTGAVARARDLAAIADAIAPHGHVWIMADDMYEHLILDGSRHVTLAEAAPHMRARVLTVSGVSKTYAMTGWRVGFAAGPAALIAAMARVQGQSTGGVSPIAQAAAAAALDGPQERIVTMRDTYRARRDLVHGLLVKIPGLRCHLPEGAFYLFPGIGAFLGTTSPAGRAIGDDEAFCAALLEEGLVATVHGAAFGLGGHVRISTATDEATLREACRRIAHFCASLRFDGTMPR